MAAPCGYRRNTPPDPMAAHPIRNSRSGSSRERLEEQVQAAAIADWCVNNHRRGAERTDAARIGATDDHHRDRYRGKGEQRSRIRNVRQLRPPGRSAANIATNDTGDDRDHMRRFELRVDAARAASGKRPSRLITKKMRVCPNIIIRMTEGSARPAASRSRLPICCQPISRRVQASASFEQTTTHGLSAAWRRRAQSVQCCPGQARCLRHRTAVALPPRRSRQLRPAGRRRCRSQAMPIRPIGMLRCGFLVSSAAVETASKPT
jgi:hypothetical protein